MNADSESVLAIEQGSVVQFNLFSYSLNSPASKKDSEGYFAVPAVLINAAIGAATGAVWGGISAVMIGESISNGIVSGAISGGVSGALGTIGISNAVFDVTIKAAIGAACSVASYLASNGKDSNLAGVLTSGISGATAGALSAITARAFPVTQGKIPIPGNIAANAVVSYMTTGISATAVNGAHKISKICAQKKFSPVAKPQSTINRNYYPGGRGCAVLYTV